MCVRARANVCVRLCMRACVHARARACLPARLPAFVCAPACVRARAHVVFVFPLIFHYNFPEESSTISLIEVLFSLKSFYSQQPKGWLPRYLVILPTNELQGQTLSLIAGPIKISLIKITHCGNVPSAMNKDPRWRVLWTSLEVTVLVFANLQSQSV